MKLRYLPFLILLFPSSFFAQDYIPLVVEDKHWIYGTCGDQGGGGEGFSEYLLRGDTLINEMVYKKIFSRRFQIPTQNYVCQFIEEGVSKPYVITNENYIGAIREDIDQKKVWLLQKESYSWFGCYENEQEHLIFDFSQEVGDTIVFCPDNLEDFEEVDTIILQSTGELVDFFGERRVNRYEYEYNIYEGIGSRLGLQMPRQLFLWVDDGYYTLLDICQGTDFECLFDNTAVHNILQTASVKISPSPSDGNFTLQLEREIRQNTSLQILSSQGRLILEQSINNPTVNVNADLPTGLYFLSIIEEGKQIWSGKTIVKD